MHACGVDDTAPPSHRNRLRALTVRMNEVHLRVLDRDPHVVLIAGHFNRALVDHFSRAPKPNLTRPLYRDEDFKYPAVEQQLLQHGFGGGAGFCVVVPAVSTVPGTGPEAAEPIVSSNANIISSMVVNLL
jgi:hypothetical protein